ncbi:thioesterase family protein [Rhodococcus sp. ARC_M6]|uniref:acyl-CoA thioesterase n=1 Tax=Rhodococcus sp. ARC_M6 TaxID=2928852 RepID=UPI001FB28770|nr:acyl-CoA thioesterase [Rhodococcus sp. ARC_M6]MCJ0903195.1 acyl-CoA thioesterase [Rhodococcus sp. ARC_M6]
MADAFSCEVQVRWGDSDRLGHVNNTKYAEYMQEARIQFLESKLAAHGGRPGYVVVRKMTIEFLKPVTDSSGPLQIDVVTTHVGKSSFTVRHIIRDNTGAECAFGDALMVGFDKVTEKSRTLAESERSVLEAALVSVNEPQDFVS